MRPESKRDTRAIAQRIMSLTQEKRALLALLLREPTGAGLAPRPGQGTASRPRSALVALQPSGSKPPLFCVPPVFGTVFPYYHLAHCLGAAQPLYGVQPLGIDGVGKPHTRLEDMAAHAIEAVRTLQPAGPYFLGGYSFGGLVAFEMAQQLREVGQQVGLLALFDTWAPMSINPPGVLDTLALCLAATIGVWPYIYDWVSLVLTSGTRHGVCIARELPLVQDGWPRRQRTGRLHAMRQPSRGDSVTPRESKGVTLHQPAIRAMLRVCQANMRASRRYVPRPYPHRITLLRTGRPSATGHHDPTRGWGKLAAAEVDVHWITGDHLTVMRKPHVQVLADTLRACLEQGEPS